MPFPYIANEAGWIVHRGWPPALDHLRPDAHRRRRLTDGRERRNALHSHRFRRHVLFTRCTLSRIWCCVRLRSGRASWSTRAACSMNVAGFVVIAFMLTVYVLLDGYDLGIGAITPLVARGERERAAIDGSIGPFWNGNEVWLIAAGGALFALFPVAYASSFSGFYLAVHHRAVAADVSRHRAGAAQSLYRRLWHEFWDAAFSLSSALLIFLFGRGAGKSVARSPARPQRILSGELRVLAESICAARRPLCPCHAGRARRSICRDAHRRRAGGRAHCGARAVRLVVRSGALSRVTALTFCRPRRLSRRGWSLCRRCRWLHWSALWWSARSERARCRVYLRRRSSS